MHPTQTDWTVKKTICIWWIGIWLSIVILSTTFVNPLNIQSTEGSILKKQIFSHSLMTSALRLHILQFSLLIGPYEKTISTFNVTRNGPITVFKARLNLVLRSGLKPTDRSVSMSHSPARRTSQPRKLHRELHAFWKSNQKCVWSFCMVCISSQTNITVPTHTLIYKNNNNQICSMILLRFVYLYIDMDEGLASCMKVLATWQI